MSKIRRSLTVAAVSCLVLSGLGLNASAEEPAAGVAAADTPMAASSPAEDVAVGLIVMTTTATPSDSLLEATGDALGREAEVVDDDKLLPKVSTMEFDGEVPDAVATEVAKQIEKRADVLWAVPDRLRRAQAAPPINKNDTHFARQTNLWDKAAGSPAGGYGVKAPSVWRVSEGEGTVVAVLDTGVIPHPDLAGNLVPGYDMVSSSTRARDGNGRDANPRDEGDWETRNQCYRGTGPYNSSWHGTFVAGQIAAVANNRKGIAGVAPGAKIQPIRVLARCGGTDSDILTGMVWAAGLPVKGLPVNETPADVVNMSLSGMARNGSERNKYCALYNKAAAAGMANGTLYIAAAGNAGGNANLAMPASCSNIISVSATSLKGFRASYSNTGSTVDLTAPGGDTAVEGSKDSIISLSNSGKKRYRSATSAWTYVRNEGTSMAAPHVAGAAAILYSLGLETPAEVRAGLYKAISPYRFASSYRSKRFTFWGKRYKRSLNCSTRGARDCGLGQFDMAKIQAPVGTPTVGGELFNGHPILGRSLRASGLFTSATRTFTWYRLVDGQEPVNVGRGEYYRPAAADVGHQLMVRMHGAGPFAKFSSSSEPMGSVTVAPDVTISIGEHHSAGEPFPVRVNLTSPKYGVPITDGPVEVLYGDEVVASGMSENGVAQIVVPAEAWRPYGFWVSARYLGAGLTAPGVSEANYTTGYFATPTIASEVTTPGTSTTPATIKVTITTPSAEALEGRVTVYAKGASSQGLGYLEISDEGTKSITLPLLPAGQHQLLIQFEARNSEHAPAVARPFITIE